MKTLRYAVEALGLHILYFIFRILPVDLASGLGGWLGRTIGPRLAASRKALRNIGNALPDLPPAAQRAAITDMWDNLGRVIAEYPHLEYITRHRTTITGEEIIKDIIAQDKSAVLFGAHIANWELGCTFVPLLFDHELEVTYRAPNNPWSDKLLHKARTLKGRITAHPKSRVAGRALIQAIQNKIFIGVLLDQKYNEGVRVPFLGQTAMTNPVFAQMCQKYDVPLVPVRSKRLKGAHFELTVYPPLNLDQPLDSVLKDVNAHMGAWIKDAPGEWLWLHRRWDSQKLKDDD